MTAGEREGLYGSEGRPSPEDPKPYAGGTWTSEQGSRRLPEVPRRAGGVFGGGVIRQVPEATLRVEDAGGHPSCQAEDLEGGRTIRRPVKTVGGQAP
ncbi:hypothetical protein GUJ93_ZPchr0016g2512 [Zizania palustris]|uniref:Uncharacterized protein n=1 Tax=Zizania palustris TaxID=103762 RepID=A0A8J5VT16_ZIZPA|nr:hypothetical protein GUJ93_ZPchr0016g2512 [Zizania palustris]